MGNNMTKDMISNLVTDNVQHLPTQLGKEPPVGVEKFTERLTLRNRNVADMCFKKADDLRKEAARLEELGHKLDKGGESTAKVLLDYVSFVEEAAVKVSAVALVGLNK